MLRYSDASTFFSGLRASWFVRIGVTYPITTEACSRNADGSSSAPFHLACFGMPSFSGILWSQRQCPIRTQKSSAKHSSPILNFVPLFQVALPCLCRPDMFASLTCNNSPSNLLTLARKRIWVMRVSVSSVWHWRVCVVEGSCWEARRVSKMFL